MSSETPAAGSITESLQNLAKERAQLRLDLAAQMMAAIVRKNPVCNEVYRDTIKDRARAMAKGAFIYADALIEEWEGEK